MAADKPSSCLRWPILIMGCVMMIGSYYCYDNPAALSNVMMNETGWGMTGIEFQMQYTVYSLPNTVLPFVGGLAADKYGMRTALMVFISCIVVGQAVYALGATLFPNSGWLETLYFGRFIFGLGGESLCVAETALLAVWFKDKEMAFAMGCNLSVSRLGSVINYNVTQLMYKLSGSIAWALWFGFIVCCLSFAAAIFVVYVDWKFDKKASAAEETLLAAGESGGKKAETDSGPLMNVVTGSDAVTATPDGSSAVRLNTLPRPQSGEGLRGRYAASAAIGGMGSGLSKRTDSVEGLVRIARNNGSFGSKDDLRRIGEGAKGYGSSFGSQEKLNRIVSGQADSHESKKQLIDQGTGNSSGNATQNQDESEAVGFWEGLWTDVKNVRKFERRYWIILCSCVVVYATVMPFMNTVKSYLSVKYDGKYDQSEIAMLMGIPYLISAIASPFLGAVVDRLGMRAILVCASAVVLTLVHALFAFTSVSPLVPLILMGVAYSVYAAAMWPAVAYVCPSEDQLGVAYGVITAVQNFGLATVPLVTGAILTPRPGEKANVETFYNVEIFFTAVGAFGVLLGILLNVADYTGDGALNASHYKPDIDNTLVTDPLVDKASKV